ncbi:MAG: SixA phosphatase family protein [Phycisphaeraceae bacterium]
MRLILLRHGVAEVRRPGLDDADRKLTDAGVLRTRQAVRGLAAYLKHIDAPPDAVLTSPKRRARETAELFCESAGGSFSLCDALGTGALDRVIAVLAERDEQTIALVGHEPQLSMLAERLCGARELSFIELKKAGAVVLRIHSLNSEAPWSTLEALLPPRALRGYAPNP